MRKLLKPLASLIAATTLAGTAWADNWGYHATDRSWIVIKVGDVSTAYSLDGSGLPAFQYADLGVITQGDPLTIVKYDTKTWKNGGNVTGCAYSYAIDGGTAVDMGGTWVKDLGWDGSSQNQLWGRNSADADQYSSSTDVNAVIDTSTLPLGRHTLTIYGEITGGDDPAGPISDGPYVAGFMVADSSGGGSVTENTVTYTVESTSAVSTSGTAPSGSSPTYSSTYGTPEQLTKNNSMTLTLSGYAGKTITGLTLSMKSNSKGGAGSLSVQCGTATIASISDSAFNTANWHGGWSTSYVDITPSVTEREVDDGEDVVITISASANSLYCQSFTITYTEDAGPGTFAITLDPDEAFTVGLGETATIKATPKDAAAGPISYAWTINGNPAGGSGYVLAVDTTAIGTYTVTCTATDSEDNTTAPVSVSYSVVTKYAVTIDDSIENGTVTVDKATAAENEQVTVTAIADPGYGVATVTVDDSDEITGPPYTFTMPAHPVTVSATFSEVVDYATLPFEHKDKWNGADVTGMTYEGLGSDYADKSAKFDTTGDWLQVKFVGTPGTLSYSLKGNSLSGSYVFDVVESETGAEGSWTQVKHHTPSENALSTSEKTTFTADLSAGSHFVRFVYTTKASGNVGLNDLVIGTAVPVTKYPVTIDDSIVGGSVTADKAEAAAGATVNVAATPDRGYALVSVTVDGSELVGDSFEMPAHEVEISATFVAVPVYKRIESADDFVTGAKYLVVAYKDGNSSYTSALKNVATDNDQISVDETISIEFADDGKFISVDNASIVWKILHTSSVAGQYALFNEAATVYVAALSGGNKAQLLSADDGNLAQWTFNFTDVPEVKMKSLAYPNRWFQRNGTINNKFFTTYEQGGTDPWLFIDESTEYQEVTFNANGGSVTWEKMKYVKGDKYPKFEMPVRDGYVFVGWYDAREGGNRVVLGQVTDADSRTLYAHWVDYQTVKFVPNGGTCDTTPLECAVGGTYPALPEPTWDGHAFQGWFTAPVGGDRVAAGDDVIAKASLVLYAQWSGQETQVVTFNPGTGTCTPATLQCVIGGTYPSFPTPVLAGSTFKGWYTAEGTRVMGGMAVIDGSRLEVFARWADTQTLKFEAAPGTCDPTSLACSMAGKYPQLPTPVWSGHDFQGWFTASDGGDLVQAGDPVTTLLTRTLYAHWSGSQTLVFDPNGGNCKTPFIVCELGGTYPGFPGAWWTGHVFKGWFTAADGGTRVRAGMDMSDEETRTLYAHWTDQPLAIAGIASKTKTSSGKRAAGVPENSEYSITFDAVADCVYEVLWTPVLGGEWTAIRRWTAESDGETTIVVSLPSDEQIGFFRLAILVGE